MPVRLARDVLRKSRTSSRGCGLASFSAAFSRVKKIAELPAEWHLIQPFLDGVHALANHSRPVFQQT